jgi:alkylhydroperoxidase family enzyme
MRLKQARIEPVEPADWNEAQRMELAPHVERGTILNVSKTMARNPDALKGFLAWARYVNYGTALSSREREIVILRIGFLCRSGYEWMQHVRMGMAAGLTAEEVERIKGGADAAGWSDADRALLNAADELHHDYFISNATWAALKRHFDDFECMDVVFAAGLYTQISMALNTFGVQLEEGLELDPDLAAF